ncbi:MAG: KUP/HAK/KT family potassium transporter, partial [Gammaproteobacteria bacterium]
MAQPTETGLGRNAQREALKRAPSATPHSETTGTLALAVLGVVYGDIGTSPIYALRQCFSGVSPVAVSVLNVYGVLSLIFWSLILIISVKYMTFILRADNRGEGGIFALLALLDPDQGREHRLRKLLLLLGIAGAAMLYGGTMITPAISPLIRIQQRKQGKNTAFA